MKRLHVLLGLVLMLFSAVTFAQMIDINTATADQLDKGLAGIGPTKAAAIVKYREENGPFQSVDDLAKVPGIKGKTLEKIKPMASVGGTAPPAANMPSMPAKPSVPSVPSMPGTPSVPSVPAKPSMPGTPTIPAKPALPSAPPQQ